MIPKDIKDNIDYVIKYAGDVADDWFEVKKQILSITDPKRRSLFSRRHYSTKKHILNDFDYKVIEYWQLKTGVKLKIDESKLHPKDWIRRPRGWGLKKYYADKRKQTNKNIS